MSTSLIILFIICLTLCVVGAAPLASPFNASVVVRVDEFSDVADVHRLLSEMRDVLRADPLINYELLLVQKTGAAQQCASVGDGDGLPRVDAGTAIDERPLSKRIERVQFNVQRANSIPERMPPPLSQVSLHADLASSARVHSQPSSPVNAAANGAHKGAQNAGNGNVNFNVAVAGGRGVKYAPEFYESHEDLRKKAPKRPPPPAAPLREHEVHLADVQIQVSAAGSSANDEDAYRAPPHAASVKKGGVVTQGALRTRKIDVSEVRVSKYALRAKRGVDAEDDETDSNDLGHHVLNSLRTELDAPTVTGVRSHFRQLREQLALQLAQEGEGSESEEANMEAWRKYADLESDDEVGMTRKARGGARMRSKAAAVASDDDDGKAVPKKQRASKAKEGSDANEEDDDSVRDVPRVSEDETTSVKAKVKSSKSPASAKGRRRSHHVSARSQKGGKSHGGTKIVQKGKAVESAVRSEHEADETNDGHGNERTAEDVQEKHVDDGGDAHSEAEEERMDETDAHEDVVVSLDVDGDEEVELETGDADESENKEEAPESVDGGAAAPRDFDQYEAEDSAGLGAGERIYDDANARPRYDDDRGSLRNDRVERQDDAYPRRPLSSAQRGVDDEYDPYDEQAEYRPSSAATRRTSFAPRSLHTNLDGLRLPRYDEDQRAKARIYTASDRPPRIEYDPLTNEPYIPIQRPHLVGDHALEEDIQRADRAFGTPHRANAAELHRDDAYSHRNEAYEHALERQQASQPGASRLKPNTNTYLTNGRYDAVRSPSLSSLVEHARHPLPQRKLGEASHLVVFHQPGRPLVGTRQVGTLSDKNGDFESQDAYGPPRDQIEIGVPSHPDPVARPYSSSYAQHRPQSVKPHISTYGRAEEHPDLRAPTYGSGQVSHVNYGSAKASAPAYRGANAYGGSSRSFGVQTGQDFHALRHSNLYRKRSLSDEEVRAEAEARSVYVHSQGDAWQYVCANERADEWSLLPALSRGATIVVDFEASGDVRLLSKQVASVAADRAVDVSRDTHGTTVARLASLRSLSDASVSNVDAAASLFARASAAGLRVHDRSARASGASSESAALDHDSVWEHMPAFLNSSEARKRGPSVRVVEYILAHKKEPTQSGDFFGFAAAANNDLVVVGCYMCSNDRGMETGTVMIYKRFPHDYELLTELMPTDGVANMAFGAAVAVTDNFVAVAAPFDNHTVGAVYMFERMSHALWQEVDKLVPSDIQVPGMFFGVDVAMHANVLAVGMRPGVNEAVYAYAYDVKHSKWGDERKVVSPDHRPLKTQGDKTQAFGSSLAFCDDILMVGAPRDNDRGQDAGAVYAFAPAAKHPSKFEYQTKIFGSDTRAYDNFGGTGSVRTYGGGIACDGDTLAVAAVHTDTLIGTQRATTGSVYVFKAAKSDQRHSRLQWDQDAKLEPSDVFKDAQFGTSVSVYGRTVVVGAPKSSPGNRQESGAAYIFVRRGHMYWEQVWEVNVGDGQRGDHAGTSVVMTREVCVVMSPSRKPNGIGYVFAPDV